MAITKIHNIKTTLNKAIDYICNGDKTDEEILISSFACGHKSAHLEFEKTRKSANSRVKILARHLIQAFDPEDDISPEMAHEIGVKLLDELLKGEYEYVITTHIDKGHIHNHVIFNNVSYVDNKGFECYEKTYDNIRKISDRLCKEYGLNVIDENNPKKEKGKTYKEYLETKKGSSWKAKLKYQIDLAIKKANDWEDFLSLMRLSGYEIKDGKYISFRATGQTRFTRSKTIGSYYTEEKIKERIEKRNKYKARNSSDLSNIIDIKNNEKTQKFAGYKHWAKLHNVKNAAKTISIMNKLKISSMEELENKIVEENTEMLGITKQIRSLENNISTNKELLKHIAIYKKHKQLYYDYKHSNHKADLYRAYSDKIILFEASLKALKSLNIKKINKTTNELKTAINKANSDKTELMDAYELKRASIKELNAIKSNLHIYLGKETNRENER